MSWEMHYSPIDPTLATQENEDCAKTHWRNSWGQTYYYAGHSSQHVHPRFNRVLFQIMI